jgi:hypothetical protein
MQDIKDIDLTLRICQHCGGSKLVAYDPNCEHYWPTIQLEKRHAYQARQRKESVLVWCAFVRHRERLLETEHPVAEEAVRELRRVVAKREELPNEALKQPSRVQRKMIAMLHEVAMKELRDPAPPHKDLVHERDFAFLVEKVRKAMVDRAKAPPVAAPPDFVQYMKSEEYENAKIEMLPPPPVPAKDIDPVQAIVNLGSLGDSMTMGLDPGGQDRTFVTLLQRNIRYY